MMCVEDLTNIYVLLRAIYSDYMYIYIYLIQYIYNYIYNNIFIYMIL